jgi:hypothetical protein
MLRTMHWHVTFYPFAMVIWKFTCYFAAENLIFFVVIDLNDRVNGLLKAIAAELKEKAHSDIEVNDLRLFRGVSNLFLSLANS